MYIIILILAIAMVISFFLARKVQNKIVSDLSPFSFADDMLIINTGIGLSMQNSSIDYIELQYNPKTLKNRRYDMKIRIVKTDGSCKNICYRGCVGGAQPQDMMTFLAAHHIKCTAKE